MAKRPDLPVDSIPQQVGADRRLGRLHTKPASSPRIQNLIDHVTQHGYVIIPGAFTPPQVAEARAEIARLSESPSSAGPAAARGRNPFEGFRTQRIYALVNKSRVFDKFAVHEDVLALNDHFLDPGYLLNGFQSINILPGEAAQTMHYDHGYVTLPRPHRPVGTGLMVALDDFTSTNGATVIVPRSHTWDSTLVPHQTEAIPAIMPAGSILFFLSTLWHGGGANTSSPPESRLAFTVQYCQPWIRPMENQILAVDWEKLDDIPPRLVDLLGYKVASPFLGMVDGGSPRAAVEKIMKRWRAGEAKL